ncbi:MAG: PD40 domain-containing protein [Marinilabiliaceae bacterium]|nr:PD40 domain-containing protein [Marinilabiliaceae bacterium]
MKYLVCIIAFIAFTSCVEHPTNVVVIDAMPVIYPDYVGVTIPASIAPMNFSVEESGLELVDVRVVGSEGGEIHVRGEWADFEICEWHTLLSQNIGGTLTFNVMAKVNGEWQRYKPFEMIVSDCDMTDYGVVYRRIAPGFETFSTLGMYQRCLATFEESAIIESRAVDGSCMNCHYSNRGNPEQFSLHIRGKHGCTIIHNGDEDRYLNTKTSETAGACTYGYWHPEGRYCAYSLNRIYQNFYVGPDKIIEPWDAVSDIAILDTHSDELIVSPLMSTHDFETTPAFSADGRTLFFCKAPYCEMPAGYNQLHYSLCAVAFDEKRGAFGDSITTILDGDNLGKSISLPRPSYDGRWLMFCMTDYGTTPLNRMESDLYLLDMQTGITRVMDEVNSNESDAYHNWSSDANGWFLFGSKREDHLYSLLYFALVDETGHATKPFLLPQRNPKEYYRENLHSFNAPDFTTRKVELNVQQTRSEVLSGRVSAVRIKH